MKQPERASAILALDHACPRCAAWRAPQERFCVECGLPLPAVRGALPALRRLWLRRLGHYPGDAVWLPLAALAVAVVGAGIAIDTSHSRSGDGPATVVATASGVAGAPTAGAASAGGPRWTIVLASYPEPSGTATARATARRATSARLPQVGTLDSNLEPNLQPGYAVVSSGNYPTRSAAQAAVARARQAGFGGAYPARIDG